MKKWLILLLICFLAILSGCSGGGGSTNKPPTAGKYFYKWSTSIPANNNLMLANNLKANNLYNSVVPPFASVSITDGSSQGVAAIYTFYDDGNGNQTPVDSVYTCDPNEGKFSVTAGNVTVFYPKKVGISTVTATYGNEILSIPIGVYQAINLEYFTARGFDFDTMTFINDISNPNIDFYLSNTGYVAPHGMQIKNEFISNILTAPGGEYSLTEASWPAPGLMIIKTSGGRYAKLSEISIGDQGMRLTVFASNEQGVFAY